MNKIGVVKTKLSQFLRGVFLFVVCLLSSACATTKPFNFEGVWALEQYGTVLNIQDSVATLYELTPISCIKTDNGKLELSADGFSLFDLQIIVDDERNIRFRDLMGYELSAHKIEGLPDLCVNTVATKDELLNFEVFWQTFNTHYAFFDLHELDWQAQYDSYRPQVKTGMGEEALLELLTEMLAPLKDGHIFLMANLDGEELEFSPDSLPTWIEEWPTLRDTLFGKYLQQEPELFGDQGVLYSRLADDIAYLNIIKMAGYYELDEDEPDLAKDQEILRAVLDTVFKTMNESETKALVLDIRFNGGGFDANAGLIASYFNAKKRKVYSKTSWYKNGFAKEQDIYIENQTDTLFDKPVILLTSGVTASAAEIFTLMMRDLANVTVIGEPTSGEFSDIFERQLPNGWQFGLSNERYTATDGNTYEKVGITPDELVQLTFENIRSGRDVMLDRALELLK